MRKLLFGLIILFASSTALKAQQDAEYSMYMFNGLYLNPAYAGSKEVISTTAIFRYQWAGIEDAPRTGSFSIHTPFKRDQYAVGFTATVDKIGFTDLHSFMGSFAYRMRLNNTTKLSLGVQAGLNHYFADLRQADFVDGQDDPAFNSNTTLFLPNFGFGAYLYSKRYYVGASIPHLVNAGLIQGFSAEGTEEIARQYKHYLATAGVVIGPDNAFVKFKPSILMKAVKGAPIDFDLNASVLLNDRFWLGASYRTGGDENSIGESIIGIAEFLATPQLRVGYAYDFTLSDLNDFNSGTHEIMVGYDFGFNKSKFVTPRYVTYF